MTATSVAFAALKINLQQKLARHTLLHRMLSSKQGVCATLHTVVLTALYKSAKQELMLRLERVPLRDVTARIVATATMVLVCVNSSVATSVQGVSIQHFRGV